MVERIGHAGDQPERRGFRRVDQPASEEQVLDAGRPDHVEETGVIRRRQAVAERSRNRYPELRVGGADAEIAGERDGAAAARGDALDLSEGCGRHALEPIDDAVDAALVRDGVVARRKA